MAWDPDADPDAQARGFNPPRTQRLWRDTLLPRTTWPAFWAFWLLLLPSRVWRRRPSPPEPRLAIESGRIGWTHVFYEELLRSAREYLDDAPVAQLVIDREQPYRPQFRVNLDRGPVSHLVIDPRTGSQEWRRVLTDLMVVGWALSRRRITPIVILTDASLRRHRLQAAVLTAFDGVVVTFMAADLISPAFPHRRIVGPLPMPVSVARLLWLENVRSTVSGTEPPAVQFIGSVYPPRAQFLAALAERLDQVGIELRVNADKYGTSNDDYWTVLATSDVIVTTTLQGMPRRDMDWIWNQQLVFRFSEALSAGAALAAPEVPGGDAFFAAGRDFVPFGSLEDAVRVLCELVQDPEHRHAVQTAGHQTASRLDRQHEFWRRIDAALGRHRLRS